MGAVPILPGRLWAEDTALLPEEVPVLRRPGAAALAEAPEGAASAAAGAAASEEALAAAPLAAAGVVLLGEAGAAPSEEVPAAAALGEVPAEAASAEAVDNRKPGSRRTR